MIKVLLNGTPIYKLCFARRRYSQVKRKHVGLDRIIKAVNDARVYEEGDEAATKVNVIDAVKAVFSGRPLYETTAIVYMIDAKKGEPPVASATVKQNPADQHSPEEGRQKAIDKLLRFDDGQSPVPFNKVERTAIRAAYTNRPRIKSTPKKTPPPTPITPAATRPSAGHRVTQPAPVRLRDIKALAAAGVHHVVNKVVPITRPWFAYGGKTVH